MTRGEMIRSRREDLERLAAFLRLRIDARWSKKHLASLIYWRCSRYSKRKTALLRSLVY